MLTTCIALAKAINSAGLILDIVGAALLFLFGLPPPLAKGGEPVTVLDPAKDAQWRRFRLLSWVGASALLLGFALQLVSNFL